MRAKLPSNNGTQYDERGMEGKESSNISGYSIPERKQIIVLMHSKEYTKTLAKVMGGVNTEFEDDHNQSVIVGVHRERDVLLASLLRCCGFFQLSFLKTVPPPLATRQHLELFHSSLYLDLLDTSCSSKTKVNICDVSDKEKDNSSPKNQGDPGIRTANEGVEHRSRKRDYWKMLDKYGLTDDCALPDSAMDRNWLWTYCR